MESCSQSGQDLWVNAVLEGKRDGFFLDVGANHPVELSNTYALQNGLGWGGVLVERDEHCLNLLRMWRQSDRTKIIEGDATKMDLLAPYRFTGINVVDYLSIDIDENTEPALRWLLQSFGDSGIRFRVLTVETDQYRFGQEVADRIDGLLASHGYDILCKNVRASDGSIYESWAVDPKLVNMKVAERFRSDGLKWSDILAKA
jgi:hypothetical protein